MGLTFLGLTLAITAELAVEFWVFDNRPPISAIVQTPQTPYVTSYNRMFRYRATYNKRTDCEVIKGHYEIEGRTLEGSEFKLRPFRVVSEGSWSSGWAQEATSSIVVPADVPPGIYNIWWNYVYRCDDARRPLRVVSPPMELRVRG